MSDHPRILVVKLSSLGDLFHALPAVHLLKQHTGAAVDWVVQPEYRELVGCFTDVDRVLVFPRKNCLGKCRAFRKSLRSSTYDLAFDFQGLFKSALITRTARAKERVGPVLNREGAHWFYHRTVGSPDPNRHAVDRLLDLAEAMGAGRKPVHFPVQFPKAELDLPRPLIGLAPFSRWPAKDWPLARFAETGRALVEKTGGSLVLLGGPADQDGCRQLEQALPMPVHNLAGKTSLVELGGVLQDLDLLLSVDSGPMHMAAAAGTPVLALFGVTDPSRTGPYGDHTRALLSPDLADHPRLARAFKDHRLADRWDIPTHQVVEAAQLLHRGQS